MPVNFTRFEVTNFTIVKVFLWALFFYGLYYFRELILILFLSIIIASVIDRAVSFFKRAKVPRVATVIVIYVLLVSFISLSFYFLVPAIAHYINLFIQNTPKILESLKMFGKDSTLLSNLSVYADSAAKSLSTEKIFESLKVALFGGAKGFVSGAGAVLSGSMNFVLVLVISFYLSLEERSVQKFLRLVVSKKYEDYIVDLWDRSQAKISAWFIGQVSIALLIAILVYIALLIIGVPFAFIISVIAFFGEMVPVVGLTVSGAVAAFVAFTHGGASLLFITAVVFLILSQFESHFLYPKVMGRAVGMPTVIVILSLVIGATIAGFWGVVVSIPASSFVVELLSDFDKRKRKEWEDIF